MRINEATGRAWIYGKELQTKSQSDVKWKIVLQLNRGMCSSSRAVTRRGSKAAGRVGASLIASQCIDLYELRLLFASLL